MTDLLERVLGFIPTYLRDLPSLVQGPKRFVSQRLATGGNQIQDALVFLGISFLIGWVLKISFAGPNLLADLGSDAAYDLIAVLAYGAVLYLAWRIVKGQAELQKFLIIHFYYSGILLLLFSCWFLAFMGTLRAEDVNLYTQFLDNVHKGNSSIFFKNHPELFEANPVFSVVYLTGSLVLLTWIAVGWGAYRELNHLSKSRSALAAGVFVFLWFPITALFFVIANGMVR